MTILVTGATGFIGRHVCASLTAVGHPVAALLRDRHQLEHLRKQVNSLGGSGDLVQAIEGNLNQTDLGLREPLPQLTAIVHLGALFGWRLDPAIARRTNVEGSLAVARLADEHRCRLVFISGFMLENTAHLNRLGINLDAPATTNWPGVYQKAGAYEASKLEAAFRMRSFATEHQLDFVEVQPATVAGHSRTGELDEGQPLHALLSNLARRRLARVPGTPDHWLPLVAVDFLASLIATATVAREVPNRLLALDPATPHLRELLHLVANAMGCKPPKGFVPIPLLSALLKVPGLSRLLNTYPEALHFIQQTRFDTSLTETFMAEQELSSPDINAVLLACAASLQQPRRPPGG